MISSFTGPSMSVNQSNVVESKRKDRESTGSDSSSSPVDKRQRNSSQQSMDDEVMDALKMVENFGDKMNTILSKLEKLNQLDSIDTKLSSIEGKIAALESNVSRVQQKQEDLEGDVKDLTKSANFLSSEVEQVKEQQKAAITEVNNDVGLLRIQLLYQNCYTRRENLNFFGICEKGDEDTELTLRNFMSDVLKLDGVDRIEFQRIHRSGLPRTNGPRPIIARFLRYTDRVRVYREGFLRLKDTRFRVLEDYPKEIIESRRKLVPLLKEAKAQGKKAHFCKPMPDRLIIDGKFIDS